ncbi:DUF4376 domain-containing protein [Halomonas sp. HG01]|uniref:DUF4376 domain-containing protein n=1 Tax=Halomonas sp. HG01 TaxID=1609967 RepID=UPI000A9BE9B6|nr:DUF4376 domain-containing protein [Halomonas sp. HG01]
MRIYDINLADGTVIDPAGREAPLDPMRREPRIPAGATSIEPPATGEREAARWAGDAWEVVADWRGHVYWLADGSRHEIAELGVEPPAEALDEAPPEPLGDLAARKRDDLEAGRKASEQAGITYNGIRYAGDPSNRQALMEALDLADTTGQTTFASWKDSDGLFHADHPVSDVRQALLDIATRRGQLIAREGELNAQIDTALAAEDRAALEAVEWSET